MSPNSSTGKDSDSSSTKVRDSRFLLSLWSIRTETVQRTRVSAGTWSNTGFFSSLIETEQVLLGLS